ncbi:glycosyltransferase [Microbulbifer sp. SAOS-129_SWC]|uniref:glycosyltransferase n=1 Tax=Microbulbifer sp. SAOS-129_SWC TaxID=3145235 RepID=UPI003216520D
MMYPMPMNDVREESPVGEDVDKLLDQQLARNASLLSEIERYADAFTQIERSRIGRLSLKLERLLGVVRLLRREKFLSGAGHLAYLPLEERETFSKAIPQCAFDQKNSSEYLAREYERLVGEILSAETSQEINAELIQSLSDMNADMYQKLLDTQSGVEKSLGSFSGVLMRLVESIWNGVQIGKDRANHLNRLWSDFIQFKRSHANDLDKVDVSNFNRLHYFLQVLRYALAHPYACLRTFSWPRFWRLARVLLGIEQLNGAAWIDQRFPLDASTADKPVIYPVDEPGAQSVELTFPQCDQPLVSIIIPVYNQYATTLSCLQAVLAHSAGVAYEVIVADDRSSDHTETISERIKNIHVVRNAVNLGFLKNCNNAATFARGKYLVLLNNDTNPQPGWLQSLLNVFSTQKGVGLVGPKLLFEDGVLQEAGGIIWKDGSGWNFGRGQDPNAPEVNYVKDVDYISGACVMLEKSLWDQLGGFDERFCPAYYEDTDLAFQIRARGLRTVYQPASCVVHFEGVSHGSDINSGIKKQQRINQLVFRDKWAEVLDAENHDVANNVFDARERAGGRTTLLYIDHYVPFYDKDAGSKSTFLYVKTMVEMGYRVKFLGANFFPHKPYTEALQQMGVEVLYGERYARNWKRWLEESACHIDVIYLHRPHITEGFIDEINSLKVRPKLVYFGHDLHYLRTEREAKSTGDQSLIKAARQWKDRELQIFEQVDTVLYPSDVEVAAVSELSPGTHVEQIPLYVLDPDIRKEFVHSDRKDLLFVGGFTHSPNVDAVIWFAGEVLPRILAVEPDIRLHVVGSNVPEVVQSLASDNIVVHGFVSDDELEALYSSIRVCVVPLRYGAGVKGKVLEALQSSVPLVTTAIGAEGIPEPLSVMRVADGAEAFAVEVVTLYHNEELCNAMLAARPKYIERHFSSTVVKGAIEKHFGPSAVSV